MKKLLTLFALFLSLGGTTFAQSFDWAFHFGDSGGSASVEGTDIATDAAGNVYTIGRFEDTIDVDPGAPVYALIAHFTTMGERDIFVCKHSATGAFVWAKQIAARTFNTYQYRPVIALDGSGNVIISGQFKGSPDFDPGPGTAVMSTGGVGDLFLEKLDNNGNFIWAKQMTGSSWKIPCAIKADAAGNICLTGYFEGTADFDMGAGVLNMSSASSSIPGGFVAKYTASGALSWAKQIGGANGFYDAVNAIELDNSGNVYITGCFDGTEDLDPGPATLTSNAGGGFMAYVMKLNSSGDLVWVKQTQPISATAETRGNALAVDPNGNVYYTGDYYGSVDLDPGAGVTAINVPGTHSQIFVSKLDTNGNFVWGGSQNGDSGPDYGADILLDPAGNVYLTGFYRQTVDFDMSSGVQSMTSVMPGFRETYINKLDAAGNFIWVKGISNGNVFPYAMSFDASGALYIIGQLGGYWSVDFDPGPGVYTMISGGQADAFVLKLKDATTGIEEENGKNALFTAFPNPSASAITIRKPTTGKATLRMFSINGAEISSTEMNGTTRQTDVSGLANGLYFLQLTDASGNVSVQKIQVVH